MTISTLKPGDRVTSHCTRCNDITGHAIVVIIDNAIHKVECCLCKGVHRYKPVTTNGVTSVRQKVPRTQRTPKTPSTSPSASSKATKDSDVLRHNWQYALNNTVSKPMPYSMNVAWQTNDVIDHPTFGQGVVTELLPPDKMHILFRDGVRLLKNGTKV